MKTILSALVFACLSILMTTMTPALAGHHRYKAIGEPGEVWVVSPDGTTATVTGRTLKPLSNKINPIWWFGNDAQPQPPADYQVGNPARVIDWYLRNPLQNFGSYVVGVSDRNYTVHDASGHVMVSEMADIGLTGCLNKTITGAAPWPLFFMSCTTPAVTWYAGWQPSGFFGFKFNLNNGPSLLSRAPK